jgi:putative serine/threonine protein kinase
MKLERKEQFAKGKRGLVSTAYIGDRKVLLKERNPSSVVDTIAHEAEMLKAVNKESIGPLFIAYRDGVLVREYIDGPEMMDWIPGATKPRIKRALERVIAQCRQLDLLGINKQEMTHPHKHILMRDDEPVFIDFERARRTENPKNVTQVCQWITGRDMTTLLSAKGIEVPRDAMLAHAKAYKKDHGKPAYERMLETIRGA